MLKITKYEGSKQSVTQKKKKNHVPVTKTWTAAANAKYPIAFAFAFPQNSWTMKTQI